MKKIITYYIITILFLGLAACGQGQTSDTKQGDPEITSSYEIKIPAISDEEAVKFIREFVAEKLDEHAYSGLYLEHEPTPHLIVLIQQDHLNQVVVEQLKDYSNQYRDGDPNYVIKLKPATYSYLTLEAVTDQLSRKKEELTKHHGKVLSYGINEIDNRVDVHVSKKADLNQEILNELTEGDSSIIYVTEGVTGNVDQHGIPLEKPYIVGTIMELNEETRTWLIDDQIYFSIDDGTLLLDEQGSPLEETDFHVGDQVKAWADGAILESLPAQGYAAVIQRNE